MKIISVTAHPFGPFADRTLVLAEGLTLIWGANEAGKSSWHAALYAGLCGLRRGKGGPRAEDKAFRDRHRPWGGSLWAVDALVELADGRRIRLQQDLDGGRESKAWDDLLGRDVSSEITHDGTPDGSRWLGLDRRSFLSVACVRQGQIVAVKDDSALLQDYLQRAAATASSEGTAAAAIDRIKGALSELVGLDRSSSTKPLRRAIDRVARARTALDSVRQQHEESRRGVEEADRLRLAAEQADGRLAGARLARSTADLERFRVRVARIRELQARHPGGAPVRDADDSLIQEVAGALRSWETRPDAVDLNGPDAADLRRQIDALPVAPTGDCVVHPSVLDAHRALGRSLQALELHDAQRPPLPGPGPSSEVSPAAVRELARALDQPVPVLDAVLDERRRQRQRELDRVRARRKWGLGVVLLALACAAGGVAAIAGGQVAIGAGLLIAGAGGLAWWMMQAGRRIEVRILEDLREIDSQLGDGRHSISIVLHQQQAAREKAAALGVRPEAAALQALADSLESADRLRADAERWSDTRGRLLENLAQGRELLEAALSGRGVELDNGVEAALLKYEQDCLGRSEQAADAGRRAGLMRELAGRDAAERAREDALARRDSAERELVEVAARCGILGREIAELVAALRAWQAERQQSARRFEQDSREWGELEHLLDGGDLERLEEEQSALDSRVLEMRARAGADEDGVAEQAAVDADLPRLEMDALQKAEAAAVARGQAEQRARDLGSLVEAEEELALSESELVRVRRLEQTLTTTLEFLRRAQDRVHRDLAPILASTIRTWLPEITDGRYVDVRVDPESLVVTVCEPDGQWRDASLLSQGTAEQIYLVLRMAMAIHLTLPGEPCPLLFDEVTVQSDLRRTEAMLQTLQSLSGDRQVVLFSQEQHVLEWMERHASARDRIVRLDAPLAGGGRQPRNDRST